MKLSLFKYFACGASALALAAVLTSCADDLNQSSIDPQTSPSTTQEAYYAKIYALSVLSGQKGIAEAPDISDDPGKNPFYRRVFEANEFPADGCLWTWQNDPGQSEFLNLSWNSGHIFTKMLYNRIGYNVTQCNFFLDQYAGQGDAVSVRQRAEVRFWRALYYQYFLDMFGRAPFAEHFDSQTLPTEKAGSELFTYIESEYLDLLNQHVLDAPQPEASTFGRVNTAAVWMMLARLYLNAQVYTGTPRWEEARDYADKVITESGYALARTTSPQGYTGYQQLFMGDNDRNPEAMQEIILPLRQDGRHTRSYGGSYTLISSCYGSNMTNFYGTNDSWTCIRARRSLVGLFFPDLSAVPTIDIKQRPKPENYDSEADYQADAAAFKADSLRHETLVNNCVPLAAGDDRALFYAGCSDGATRTVTNEVVNKFQDGLSFIKWTNIHADGTTDYHDAKIPDTDIPFLRLAEAYLTRAEANFRLGVDARTVMGDVNALRTRAHATPWVNTDVTADNLLAEWGREFYLEGRRRTDLVRYNAFTSNTYVWDWKGGVLEGTGVNPRYNLFPLPDTEKTNNPNMHQNPGF